jgi:hypothetical protein
MEFRIADTFTDSLARLTGKEQTAAKTTAFDLQVDPANPGMRFHKLAKAKDPNFWSVRVSKDIRLIVHRTSTSLMLCYVDHHDAAYAWAERRKIDRHPATGAAQIVEIRETVREIEIPRYVEAGAQVAPTTAKPALFADIPEEELLTYGVPAEWLEDVRQADEDTLLKLADHLPSEAAEALFDLATGVKPQVAQPVAAGADPFAHPDAQRRFRVMTNVEELQRALEYPWEKWTVFLHPAQRGVVERPYNGPARVAGSAGTGKTIVALHRAVHLARTHPKAKVLLTTFSDPLANALRRRLERLVGNEADVFDRITVRAIDAVGAQLYQDWFGQPQIAGESEIDSLIREACAVADPHRFSQRFLITEWSEIVDAWQLGTWEAYRDVPRLGRKKQLGEKQRALLWSIFERVRAELAARRLWTMPMIFARLTEHLQGGADAPFDFAVIDEAQDISIPQLKFLAALCGKRPDGLFFAGDLGQRIFRTPFSWLSLGVDVRGRSHTLRINYRTSHQIRRQADRLLGPELSDVDGITETRRGTVSVFNGPEPTIVIADSADEEIEAIASWLRKLSADGVQPDEMGIFVRCGPEMKRARQAVKSAGLDAVELDEGFEPSSGKVAISTMHLAKGLEFQAVVVAACDDEVLPFQARIEAVSDDSDLEEVYNTERHLLYVACTRARDHLLITGVNPASEFLDDLRRL